MNYFSIEPPEYLKSYIRCFGIIQNNSSIKTVQKFKIIADGCPGLIFQEKEKSFFDKDGKALPQMYLHGLTTTNSINTAYNSYNNIIVHFYPHALKAIFGIDAFELTDTYIELSDLTRNNLSDNLLNTKSLSEKIELLSAFLIFKIEQNKLVENRKIMFVISEMKKNNDNSVLKNLQFQLNISERTLERFVKAYIGVSPKVFFRINRFQSALDFFRQNNKSILSDIAYDYFYADHSHYTREFKVFSGTTPKQFFQYANEQIINFPEWKS